MRRTDLAGHSRKGRLMRTSQIVFGERQHLLRVLDSMEKTVMTRERIKQERRLLEEMIHGRTLELNAMNAAWDQKVAQVLRHDIKPETLEQLAKQAPRGDFYLLRLISEHPRTPAKTLAALARHTYPAIRENVARHPNTDPETLAKLSKDRSMPLWYLVAFNPNTPSVLRRKLQERMRKQAPQGPSQAHVQ